MIPSSGEIGSVFFNALCWVSVFHPLIKRNKKKQKTKQKTKTPHTYLPIYRMLQNKSLQYIILFFYANPDIWYAAKACYSRELFVIHLHSYICCLLSLTSWTAIQTYNCSRGVPVKTLCLMIMTLKTFCDQPYNELGALCITFILDIKLTQFQNGSLFCVTVFIEFHN